MEYMNKPINEIIIISDYDCKYGLNVWFKGEEECKEAYEIRRMYHSYEEDDNSIYNIMDKYHMNVLLCCDGDIQYFEYRS